MVVTLRRVRREAAAALYMTMTVTVGMRMRMNRLRWRKVVGAEWKEESGKVGF